MSFFDRYEKVMCRRCKRPFVRVRPTWKSEFLPCCGSCDVANSIAVHLDTAKRLQPQVAEKRASQQRMLAKYEAMEERDMPAFGFCCMNNDTGCYDERCSCTCDLCVRVRANVKKVSDG